MKGSPGLLTAILLMVSSCAALRGQHLPLGTPPDGTARGVPYYLTRPAFSIVRKTQKSAKKARAVYDLKIEAVSDPRRRFEVGPSGALFGSRKFTVTRAGSTVTKLNSKSEDKTAAVLVGLTSTAVSVARSFLLLSKPRMLDQAVGKAHTDGVIEERDRQCLGCLLNHDCRAVVDATLAPPRKPQCSKKCPSATRERVCDMVLFSKLVRRTEARTFDCLKQRVAVMQCLSPQKCGAMITGDSQPKQGSCGGQETRESEKCSLEESLAAVQRNVRKGYKHVMQLRELEARIAAARNASAATVDDRLRRQFNLLVQQAKEALVLELKKVPAQGTAPALPPAVLKLQSAVQLLLVAHGRVYGTELGAQRETLVKFLKTPLKVKDAKDLSAQMATLSKAIRAALPAKPATKAVEDLPLATDITSTIQDKICVRTFAAPLDPRELQNRIVEARAEVLVGSRNAVIVTIPQKR